MNAFHTNLNIQTMIGIFFLVLCFVTAIFGALLCRFEFLDGKSFYFSRILGVVLMVTSGILGIAAVLMLVYVRVAL